MIHYKQWDILLVPFPFTDLSSTKKRPALVISPDEYNSGPDRIIAFVSSQLATPWRVGDYHILHWKLANLPKASMIRMKIATISKAIIIRGLGRLAPEDVDNFSVILQKFFRNEENPHHV